jgi:hypothetical protein
MRVGRKSMLPLAFFRFALSALAWILSQHVHAESETRSDIPAILGYKTKKFGDFP